MSMCGSCQTAYDKWLYHVWPAPSGWIHVGDQRLSNMNLAAKRADRTALVRKQLADIKAACPGPNHNKEVTA